MRLQPHHRVRLTACGRTTAPFAARHHAHHHAHDSPTICIAALPGAKAAPSSASGWRLPSGLPPPTHAASPGIACLAAASQQGGTVTSTDPEELLLPSMWADGDVLRLTLADGRTLHAEALVGRPTARTNTAPQRQPTPAPRAATGSGGASGAGSQQVQLLCQGVRYTARPQPPATEAEAAAAAGAAAADAAAGDGGAPQSAQVAGAPALVLELAGGALPPGDPLRALLEAPPKRHAPALRAWVPLTSRLLRPPTEPAQSQQRAASGPLGGAAVVSAHRTASLTDLRRQAAAEPGAWCDGSGPSDPPPSDDARTLFTAGELASLLEGRRGVALLQLHVGWDEHDAVPPYGPYKPLVLRLLREALERPDVVSYCSAAPVVPGPGASTAGAGAAAAGGNPSYGLTMVLCADKEPFRSWGAHLASFGCQAALEAQSPYFKLLIGRILGYRPDHIAHYIKEKHGGEPSGQVVAAVEAQLTKLSPKRPSLPWNASSRGGGAGGRKKAK